MSKVKGPDFFADVPNDGFPEFFGNGPLYFSLFEKAQNEKYLGDASHYFHIPSAPKKIKEFNPKSKIIIILRAPLGVIKSHYKGGVIEYGVALNEEFAKKNAGVRQLLESLNYSGNVRRWQDALGKANVHIVLFEDLLENHREEFLKICDFLKINKDFSPEYRAHIDSNNRKNEWITKLMQIVPLSFRVKAKDIAGGKFTFRVKKMFSWLTSKKKGAPQKEEIVISSELKKKMDFEIKEMSKILNRDLSFWNK